LRAGGVRKTRLEMDGVAALRVAESAARDMRVQAKFFEPAASLVEDRRRLHPVQGQLAHIGEIPHRADQVDDRIARDHAQRMH
jgi:hypothetical protein